MKLGGKRSGVGGEAHVVAWKVNERRAEPLGQGDGRPVGELIARGIPAADDDPGRCGPERRDVGRVVGDPHAVLEEEWEVALDPGHHLLRLDGHLGRIGLALVIEPDRLVVPSEHLVLGCGHARTKKKLKGVLTEESNLESVAVDDVGLGIDAGVNRGLHHLELIGAEQLGDALRASADIGRHQVDL